jgi:nucleotide-binding universal stress UspA family protein
MKILVPIDFSENSIKALEFAVSLAKKENTVLTLVYVIEVVFDFASQAELALEAMYKDGEKQMKKTIKAYGTFGIPMNYRVVQGTAAVTISRIAEDEEMDLIVMGTQGASGIKKTLIGTVTVHVIKESTCPVLVIPSQAQLSKLHKLTLALEFSNHEEDFIDWTIDLANQWKMGFEIVHIQSGKGFREELTRLGAEGYFAKKYPQMKTTIHTIPDENPTHGLEEFMNREPNMILAMCHNHRNLWEELTKKSHSIEMAYHTRLPLLVLV